MAVMTLTFNVAVCRWRPGLPRRDVSITRFFRFGGGVFGTQIINYATKNVDNIAIGAYWGAGPLGLYSRAYQLLMTPLAQINAPLTRVAAAGAVAGARRRRRLRALLEDGAARRVLLDRHGVRDVCGASSSPRCGALRTQVARRRADLRAAVDRRRFPVDLADLLLDLPVARQDRPAVQAVPRHAAVHDRNHLAGLPWGPKGVAIGASIAYFLDWAISLWWVGRAAHVDSRMLFRNAFRSLFLVSAPCGVVAFLGTLLVSQPIAQLAVAGVLAIAYVAVLIALVPTVRDDAQMILFFVRRSIGRAKPKPKPRHRAPQVQLLFTKQP